jgi:hypothetical protein
MYPLPIVNPELSRNRYTVLQKVGASITAVALILVVWLVPCGVGSRFQLGLFLFGVWLVGYDGLLTNNGPWWAQKFSGLWGRKGREYVSK